MRYFTVSELWGPFACEHPGCTEQEAWTIKLTDEENASLPVESGPEAITFILLNKLGVALCEKHL